jgi:RND family efflux transporter MFP subunit
MEEYHDDLPRNLRKPHAITVIAVALLFLATLAALFVLGYLPHERAQAQIESDAKTVIADSGRVTVSHPGPMTSAKEIVLPCDIRPFQDTLIFPRASGYLKRLYVDINDRVQKGDTLAEIDAPEVDAQLQQARAALQQAQADASKAQTDLDLAQRTYERYKEVDVKGNTFTQQELDERATARDQSKAALAQAQANVVGAQANVHRLEVMQSFETIKAPFSGVITARNFDVGALLSPTDGRPIFHLQQSDTLRVFVNMPQVYATQIHRDQSAELTVRNFPQRVFKGTVTRTADSIDAATRTMPYEIDFPNPDRALVPGMYGQIKIALESPPHTLVIPVSAMLFNAGGTQVATVENGKVHFQKITIGRDLGTEYEVLDGLTEKSVIITNPGQDLVEGGPVKIAQAGVDAQ